MINLICAIFLPTFLIPLKHQQITGVNGGPSILLVRANRTGKSGMSLIFSAKASIQDLYNQLDPENFNGKVVGPQSDKEFKVHYSPSNGYQCVVSATAQGTTSRFAINIADGVWYSKYIDSLFKEIAGAQFEALTFTGSPRGVGLLLYSKLPTQELLATARRLGWKNHPSHGILHKFVSAGGSQQTRLVFMDPIEKSLRPAHRKMTGISIVWEDLAQTKGH